MEQIKKIVVLVVDDDPLLRMSAAEELAEDGFTALEANGSEDAIRQLEAHPEVEVLFTDIQMPGRSGLELAHLVHARWPDIHLILTSGRVRPPAHEIPDAGRFIAKPARLHAVRDTLNEMMA